MTWTTQDGQRGAAFLRVVPVFRSFSDEALERFVHSDATKVTCHAGAVLAKTRASEPRLIVIVSGTAKMTTPDGLTVILMPGDYFGGLSAQGHGSANVITAISDVEALVVGPEAQRGLVELASGPMGSTLKANARRLQRRRVLVHA